MRPFLIFLFIIGLSVLIFVGSNMMRCISSTSDPCPKLCFQKLTDCAHDTTGVCEVKKVCRAPDAGQYNEMIKKEIKEFKYQLQK